MTEFSPDFKNRAHHSNLSDLPYNEQLLIPGTELEKELHAALEKNQFELHLQPKVCLNSWSIQGMEVLLRWQHPQHGIIPPAFFIPALEQTGMIADVGQWVLGEACKLNQQWQASGLSPVPIAINVSGTQLSRARFAETVFDTLGTTNLSPEYLELEFTENSLFSDTVSNIKVCNQLRGKGIKLALDYSGLGYTSIEDISELPMILSSSIKTSFTTLQLIENSVPSWPPFSVLLIKTDLTSSPKGWKPPNNCYF